MNLTELAIGQQEQSSQVLERIPQLQNLTPLEDGS